jgi:hypothetical protein
MSRASNVVAMLSAVFLVESAITTQGAAAPSPVALSGTWSGWTTVTASGTCSDADRGGAHKLPRRVSLEFAEDGSFSGRVFMANTGELTRLTVFGRLSADSQVSLSLPAKSICSDSTFDIPYSGRLVRDSKPPTLDLKADYVLCEGSGCTYQGHMLLKRE